MADTNSFLIITCSCGQKMKVPPKSAGKTYKCVNCGAHVKAPAEATAPESPPEKPALSPKEQSRIMEPVGQLLVKEGLISTAQLQETLEQQNQGGGKLFQLLLALGFISKDDLHEFLSRQPGTAAIDLDRFEVDRDLIGLIPKEMALDSLVLPIDRLGKLLTVAMACPLDMITIAEMEQLTGLKVKAMLCRLDDIHAAVNKYYQDQEDSGATQAVFKLDSTAAATAPPSTPSPPSAPSGEATLALLNALETVPVEQSLLAQIGDLLAAPTPPWKKLGDLCAQQPTLTACLLRLANTTPFGMPGQVSSAPMALVLLQQDGVGATLKQFASPLEQSNGLWSFFSRRSVRVAQHAAALARALSSEKAPEAMAYTAGLLHALGSILFLQHPEAPYQNIESPPSGLALEQYEKEILGLSHLEANQLLAQQWRLPVALRSALASYTQPKAAEDHQELAALLCLAVALSNSTADADLALKEAPAKEALTILNRDKKWALAAVR